MRRSVLFAATALFLLAGCHSIVDKPYQRVQVHTPDVTGADCLLTNGANSYRVITPGSALVERSPETMIVTCEKGNYITNTVRFESKIDAWRNVIAPPGVIWDLADNAIYDYPDTMIIPLEFDQAAYNAANDDMKPEVHTMRKKEELVFDTPVQTTTESDKAFDTSLHK